MQRAVDLSIVVPVFNGSGTLDRLVEEIQTVFTDRRFEIVLVDDGSVDDSERKCQALARKYPETVSFVELSRNFGEHNAVLAGLSQSAAPFVGVLDDDGQNPPAELMRLWEHIRQSGLDVVYGRYAVKRHGWLRNVGSWFNDKGATLLVGKPRRLYFSSFKVMSRFLVRELLRYHGRDPYLDGMIYRTTRRIGQIDVIHRPRQSGRSGYSFGKLAGLWLNMCVGCSILPLRAAFLAGGLALFSGTIVTVKFAIDAVSKNSGNGMAGIVAGMLLLSGLQLLGLGVIGEYVGRLRASQGAAAPFVIRYVQVGDSHCE